MLLRDAGHKRPVHLGPYPLEVLARDSSIVQAEARVPSNDGTSPGDIGESKPSDTDSLTAAIHHHIKLLQPYARGAVAPAQAPVPDDLERRSIELKGAAYYLDADHAGICQLADHLWLRSAEGDYIDPDSALQHTQALVILCAHPRAIEPENIAHSWMDQGADSIAHLRCTEISIALAGHVRALGFDARAHVVGDCAVDVHKASVLAGIAQRQTSNHSTNPRISSPFLGSNFELGVVTFDYPTAVDLPLAAQVKTSALRYWFGINGAMSGRERNRRMRRETHLSRYPMEQVKRVGQPTTAIFAEEIPRVPLRANFFSRARHGDLGDKAQREVARFAYKHPLTQGMVPLINRLRDDQDGVTANQQTPGFDNAAANTKAIKSLAHALGADLAGICEVPEYAWYSHLADGEPLTPYHQYAVVMLIDQGYDTMEGASGDDWISGCQSMRGYLRGAEIAGIMARYLRSQGISARPQTNADSHVLQIPLVLLAGLGELSRIGELVLNPYVGPRFKSVVVTTDLPLVPDKPIDFGLQYFCSNCLKCARECPVSAIPFGDKVMFNGYEIWKPDVERCTSYRINNPKGSACGRCMKTCPLNKVISADGSLLHRIGTWLGINARWLKPLLVPIAVYLDDKLGFGTRNPYKRWWLDLEWIGDRAKLPRGTNERDLSLDADTSGRKTPVGYYNAADMPAPNATHAVPVNHRAAVERAEQLETLAMARERNAQGAPKPAHYVAVEPAPTETIPIKTLE